MLRPNIFITKIFKVYFFIAIVMCLVGNAAVSASSIVLSLLLDKHQTSIYVGDSEELTITLAPAEIEQAGFNCSSSDPSVAIYEEGKIKGLKEGTATLTFTSKLDSRLKDECLVTVQSRPETNFTISLISKLTSLQGARYNFTAYISPATFSDTALEWSITSNPSNAIQIKPLGKDCIVTCINPGTATLRVTSTLDRTKFRECIVTVVDNSETNTTGNTNTNPGNNTTTTNTENTNTINTNTTNTENTNTNTTNTTNTSTSTNPGNNTENTNNTNISVTNISLNNSQLSLNVGSSAALNKTITPANAANQGVTWQSSDTNVATVSASGQVTAVGSGTATITVTTTDGGYTASCLATVTAESVGVTGISLGDTQLTLSLPSRKTLAVNFTPANATDKRVTWASSNSQAVVVNSNGQITAVGSGSAIITVTTTDGGFTATCRVVVSGTSITVTSVRLNKSSLNLNQDSSETLYSIITPSNATSRAVTWRSSNTSVATVSSSGLVRAVKAGSATITVTSNSGGHFANCLVTVAGTTASATGINGVTAVIGSRRVTGVNLDENNLILPIGTSQILNYNVLPADAANTNVTWSSSNPRVARVDNYGQVTAVAPGNSKLTVTTSDGGFTASCNLVVTAMIKNGVSVLLNGEELSFDVPPRIINNRTMVPIRSIFEALGASISWEGATRTVIATRGGNTIKLQIGNYNAYKNGSLLKLDVAPQLISSRTLVPIRFIAESLGCNVDWDEATQTVIITDSTHL